MGGFIEKIKNWWLESNPTQRYTTFGGIGLTLLLLVGVYSIASRPRYALLAGGLSQADQAAIVTELQGQGVPVKYDTPGQVDVPADKVAELTMRLASTGKMPKGAHLGNENLGDMNLYTTPAVERERLRAIAEGRMATAIETNPGVRSAGVHITLGDPSPFTEQERPPRASINLITAGNGAISREAAKGIAMLVANSVDGLDMKHVAVLDERSQILFNGADLEDSGSMATSKIDMEQALARKEEMRLQNTLDQVFGANATRVSVKCEVDMDQKHVIENKRIVTKGTPTKSMVEKMKGGDSAGNLPSGISANTGRAPAADGDNKDDDYKSEVTQLEPNVVDTKTENNRAVGTIKSMIINVFADNKEGKFDDAEKLESLTTFVKNEVANKDQKLFVARVTPIAFDESTKVAITKAQDGAASAAKMQQMFSLLPIAALLIVAIMVVKQVSKFGRAPATQMMHSFVASNGQIMHVPMVNGQVPSNYATSGESMSGGNDGSGDHHVSPIGEALNKSLSKYTEAELAQLERDGVIYRDNDEIVEVEKIRERKSVHLSAIKQMAKDRPEPTAMLIKTWLAESTPR